MNKNFKFFGYAAMLTLTLGFAACSSDDPNPNPNPTPGEKYVWGTDGSIKSCDHLLFTNGMEDPKGKEIGNGNQEFVFTGKQTLKKGTYTLKGWIYIANGAELTLEPGTIIKGDKTTKASIIAERGGKLIAQGTENEPIVFTSAQPKGQRKPGDWGGVILCGKAKTNQGEQQIEGGPRTKHGGNDDADNSGVLSYVRIEFAGYPFEKDREINGLTFGSVGSGTKIDHIQVSYSNDDSYEWFGGTVNAKYLIAYKGWDDDFDTDNGYRGSVQFGLVVRDSKLADTSKSNGFESDNNASGSDVSPFTAATFSNITFVGPKVLDPNFKNTTDYITGGSMNPNNGAALGKFQAAMHIRRNSRMNCYNSVAMGYPIGLILDNQKGDTQGAAKAGKMKLENIWFAGMDIIGSDYNGVYKDELYDYKTNTTDPGKPSFTSTFFKAQKGNLVMDSWKSLVGANGYTPVVGSALLTGAVFDFAGNWFEKVPFIGAFGATDWTKGWAEFDPQNRDY